MVFTAKSGLGGLLLACCVLLHPLGSWAITNTDANTQENQELPTLDSNDLLKSLTTTPRFDPTQPGEVAVSGITEPLRDVLLIAEGVGPIVKIDVSEGQTVREGDVLLNLDNTREALEAQRFKLIWEDKTRLRAAQIKEKALRDLLADTKALFEKTKSVSREELVKKELEYDLVKAEIAQLQINEEKEKVEYQLAEERLRKRTLYAPINGTVTRVFLELGESSDARQPLLRIVDSSKCRFVCNIEERLGKSLHIGDQVDLKIGSGAAFTLKKGTVEFVSPVIDPASSLLEVKVVFDNANLDVRPGLPGLLVFTPAAE